MKYIKFYLVIVFFGLFLTEAISFFLLNYIKKTNFSSNIKLNNCNDIISKKYSEFIPYCRNENYFLKDDIFSHLTTDAYAEYFYPRIFNMIK